MIKTCNLILSTILVLGLSAGPLFAGDDDGGAKRNATIEVRNDFGFPIGVVLDADEDDLTDAGGATDPQGAFEDLGGVILNQGETMVFEAKAGAHDVFIVDGGDFTNFAEASIQVDQGDSQSLVAIEYEESIALVVAGGDPD